ncbi:MAG: hypothetical protein HYX26_01000 [Acidobacteriales bacterium]|nr:hypothetical protein [Terriglobales bacterium]
MKLNARNASSRPIFLLLALGTAGFGQTLKVEAIANPSGATSLQAHWGTAQDGSPLLSWIETLKDGSHTLRYAIRRGAQWSEPRTIATDRHFFRQPAESPSVISFADGSLLAEWVEILPASSEAEYLYVSASKNGIQWTPPVMAHQDRNPVQHALVSMVASGTSRGLLVAYRDHTSQDIRDIGVIRFENGRWLPSKILNPDKWEINACPVNGASAAAKDNRVAIAWYTEAQDAPRTQLVFSSDGGATFGKPVRVSSGNSFGHVSVALDEQGGAFVSWIEEGKGADGVRLLARQVTGAGVAGPVTQVGQGSRRSIGYPRLLHAGSETWIAWGNSGTGKIQTARLTK